MQAADRKMLADKKLLYRFAVKDQLQLAECLFFLFGNTQILPSELLLLCKCVPVVLGGTRVVRLWMATL